MHKNAVTYVDKVSAELMTQEPNGGNRDFIAQYRLAGNAIESGVLLYKDTNFYQYFLAMRPDCVRRTGQRHNLNNTKGVGDNDGCTLHQSHSGTNRSVATGFNPWLT